LFRYIAIALVWIGCTSCVTKSAYDDLATRQQDLLRERAALESRVETLELERESLEHQFLDAQEGFEDERIARTALASNLDRVEKQATTLERDLVAEREKHHLVASALARRDAELASMQSTYDSMVTDLESEVSAGQIEIERLRDGISLNVSDEVLFASGSAELDDIGRTVLVKVAGQIKRLGDFVEVRGHTDDRRIRGTLARRYPSNWELAAARAARVVRLLEAQGVAGERLAAVSRGPYDPVRPNDSAENRLMNRRIEIRLTPNRGDVSEP